MLEKKLVHLYSIVARVFFLSLAHQKGFDGLEAVEQNRSDRDDGRQGHFFVCFLFFVLFSFVVSGSRERDPSRE